MKSISRFIGMVLVMNLFMYTAGISPAAAIITGPSLNYSTYLGGTVEDRVNATALDSSGNVYLTGLTVSGTVANTFPGTSNSSLQNLNKGGTDIFVTKISAAGTLVWTTLLGGAGTDIPTAIAVVDGSGIVYITGSTTSGDFPTASPYQANTAGGTDAFVTAIKADGTGLVYSTYLGSAGLDEGNGITVDSAGNAYVTGQASADFPKTAGSYTAVGGMSDAFVAKFSPAGGIVYSTFLGGTGSDVGRAIAIDVIGNAYVTGQAADAFFPTASYANIFKTTITGSFDAFIAKLDSTGANLLYVTYVGGSNIDDAFGIALDGTNPATLNVYITGYTFSADMPKPGSAFATTGQTTIGTAPDAYVFKLNMNGGGGDLDGVYFTYLGGSGDDRATAIKVDAAHNAYVTGHTTSGDFPTVQPIQGTNIGTGMAFVTEIGPTGGTTVFSTYLGGVTDQAGNGIGLDSSGNIYVAGWTNSADFLTAPAAPIQSANAGSYDGFVAKISAPSPVAAPLPEITGVNPSGGIPAGGTTVVITGTGFNGATSIKFGGVNAASFTVDSNTQITVPSPAHATGIVNIVATNAMGSSSIVPADNYTYFVAASTTTPADAAPTITSINPTLGLIAGGTTVVITGTGFNGANPVTGANGVKFGDLNAASYTVVSNTQITAIAPVHAAGIVDIVATSLNGSSVIGTADKYTYFVRPFDPYIFPSPTTGSTAGIAYYMAGSGLVNIRVYNEIGNLMCAQEERKPAGKQVSSIDVGRLAPGVYLYLLKMEYDDGTTEKFSVRKFAVMH